MTQHLIKKYPNRRLYDTERSKYITLSDLKDLIVSGASVKVVDSNSNEDITRSILLQIIIEAEAAGEPIFSASMLQQIIRFYGGSLQGMFARYLEDSLQMFSAQQAQMREAMRTDPITTVTRMAEQNMKFWTDLQSGLFQAGSGRKKSDDDS